MRTLLRAAPVAFACLAISCSSNNNVTVTPIAAGAQCPNGGVQITVNGGTPSVVCNGTNGTNGSGGPTGGTGATGTVGSTGSTGANGGTGNNGYNTLVVTTALPVGDQNCPFGGEEIQSGLDNGAGGGTANDGILQPGEVIGPPTYICNSGSNGWIVGSTAPPGGLAGTSTIDTSGGMSDGGAAADAGAGGSANSIEIRFQPYNNNIGGGGTLGGHLKVFATGAADAGFTFPAEPNINPGANPVTITADTTVDTVTALQSDAGVGALYIDTNGALTMLLNPEDGGSAQATSLTIAADVTLTRTANPDNEGTGQASIGVYGPCANSGIIAMQADAGNPAQLGVLCNTYWGGVDSLIVNNGADGSEEEGRGHVSPAVVSDGTSSSGINILTDTFWNQGTISATGGSGGNGGSGGYVSIAFNDDGDWGVASYNSGTINTWGGRGSSGNGGQGGSVYISMGGDINNSGPINTYGGAASGSGVTGGGGGSVTMSVFSDQYGDQAIGSIRNSGAITTSGGGVDGTCTFSNSDDELVACQGGNGGSISITAVNGVLIDSGALTTAGGASVNGYGGNGAMICINVRSNGEAVNSGDNDVAPSGDLMLGANLNATGGPGAAQGGYGGPVGIKLDPALQPNGQEIILYGYASLNANGGSGTGQGGNASDIELDNNYFFANVECDDECCDDDCRAPRAHAAFSGLINEFGPGGSVINYAAINVTGGSASSGPGGSGGYFEMYTQQEQFFPGDTFEQVINAGTITSSGGDGTTGGSGDEVRLYGIAGVSNSGAITSSGGTGSSTSGGSAEDVGITSDNGPATNSGKVTLNGGSGVSQGGSAGEFYLSGNTATESGVLVLTGGTASDVAGAGGYGGYVDVLSSAGVSSVTVAAPAGINVAGGTGGASGSNGGSGYVQVDGWDQSNLWAH